MGQMIGDIYADGPEVDIHCNGQPIAGFEYEAEPSGQITALVAVCGLELP